MDASNDELDSTEVCYTDVDLVSVLFCVNRSFIFIGDHSFSFRPGCCVRI